MEKDDRGKPVALRNLGSKFVGSRESSRLGKSCELCLIVICIGHDSKNLKLFSSVHVPRAIRQSFVRLTAALCRL